jgi:hypothetical protein
MPPPPPHGAHASQRPAAPQRRLCAGRQPGASPRQRSTDGSADGAPATRGRTLSSLLSLDCSNCACDSRSSAATFSCVTSCRAASFWRSACCAACAPCCSSSARAAASPAAACASWRCSSAAAAASCSCCASCSPRAWLASRCWRSWESSPCTKRVAQPPSLGPGTSVRWQTGSRQQAAGSRQQAAGRAAGGSSPVSGQPRPPP